VVEFVKDMIMATKDHRAQDEPDAAIMNALDLNMRLEFQRNIDAWRNHMLVPQMLAPIGRWFLDAVWRRRRSAHQQRFGQLCGQISV
jgi:predicted metal-dependent HD superfamily phosphohydrolase